MTMEQIQGAGDAELETRRQAFLASQEVCEQTGDKRVADRLQDTIDSIETEQGARYMSAQRGKESK